MCCRRRPSRDLGSYGHGPDTESTQEETSHSARLDPCPRTMVGPWPVRPDRGKHRWEVTFLPPQAGPDVNLSLSPPALLVGGDPTGPNSGP